jgi:hypothetical protein
MKKTYPDTAGQVVSIAPSISGGFPNLEVFILLYFRLNIIPPAQCC